MLTLKMDIFHSGKEDANSDHKLVHERVIEVPVPAQPDDGHSITLEDCLTAYFDNRVEVNRYQQDRRNTFGTVRSGMTDDTAKGQPLHVEVADLNDSQPSTPQALRGQDGTSPFSPIRPAADRERLPSIIMTSHDPEKGDLTDTVSSPRSDDLTASRRRAGSLKKEVTMSAWQFFNLIRTKPSHSAFRCPTNAKCSMEQSFGWARSTPHHQCGSCCAFKQQTHSMRHPH